MNKLLLSGNEAIARGAFEAGVTVGTGYPGTPSSEILESLTNYNGIYTEWSINEKVALEIAIGASIAGARSICTMKHVGLNVAADPLFTASYIGVNGGLVIVTADDPNMYSSQNEQDNRHYAEAAKIPMLEPSNSNEAKEFTSQAFKLSEKYDIPFLLRTTTRISHSKSIVKPGKQKTGLPKRYRRKPEKYVMIPKYGRIRHAKLEKRLLKLQKDSNKFKENTIDEGNNNIGFITSGICYNYVKEIFPASSILKLGMIYPLPEDLIRDFASKVNKLFVVEELDPYLETKIKAMGIRVEGKKYFPITGELSPDIIRTAFNKNKKSNPLIKTTPISRLPVLCAGCPHHIVFSTLKKMNVIVTGDIGCYTLGVYPPYNVIDTCIEMGSSIGIAQGMEIAQNGRNSSNIVAVIGDSTFAHSGISSLINAAYNGRTGLIIVLDNETTAMTGMQPNPFSGKRLSGEETVKIDYKKLAASIGIVGDDIKIINSKNQQLIKNSIKGMLKSRNLSLLVIKDPCIILKKKGLSK